MKYFSAVDEGQAITCSRGIYRQSPLFVRDDRLYVKQGFGFIRLLAGGGTSVPSTNWYDIDTNGQGHYEKQGGVYLGEAGK